MSKAEDPHGVPPVFMPFAEFVPELAENVTCFDYWAALPQQASGVRLYEDCDLLDLAAHLPQCLLLDLEGPTTWTVTMIGTELVYTFGMDITGLNSYDLYSDAEKPQVAQRMATMQQRNAPMIVTSRLQDKAGVTVETEWVFLPLARGDGVVSRVLVSISRFARPIKVIDFEMGGTLENRRVLKLIYGCVPSE